MTTAAPIQLAFLLDAPRDALTDAEVAAVEARVSDDDERRSDYARPAPTCRCGPRAWGEPADDHCTRCGRDASGSGRAP